MSPLAGLLQPGFKSTYWLNGTPVSESPSRGHWKQFLLSRPYEVSQYLPAVEGDNLPRGKVSPTPLSLHVCFHFYIMTKGIEKSLLRRNCFPYPLEGLSETSNNKPFYNNIKMKAYMRDEGWGGGGGHITLG